MHLAGEDPGPAVALSCGPASNVMRLGIILLGKKEARSLWADPFGG